MSNGRCFQKQESFLKPLVDQFAKEGKDKKVVFEAIFTKPNSKPKWLFRKDVSGIVLNTVKIICHIDYNNYIKISTKIFYRNVSPALSIR